MLLTAATVYLLKHYGWYLPQMVNNYLNDLLVIPIVLACCLICVRYLIHPDTKLSAFPIISIVFLYSIYFEYYLPLHNSRYTADVIDCILYGAGGTLFYFWQKLEVKHG